MARAQLRPRGARSRTVSRLGRNDEQLGAQATEDELLEHELEASVRPRTRGECADGPRPCPWARCKHHLFLDVDPTNGSIKLNFPDLELEQLEHSCALDLADAGVQTLEEVGIAMNLTRERVRQIEAKGAGRLRTTMLGAGLADPADVRGPYAGADGRSRDRESLDPRIERLRARRARARAEKMCITCLTRPARPEMATCGCGTRPAAVVDA